MIRRNWSREIMVAVVLMSWLISGACYAFSTSGEKVNISISINMESMKKLPSQRAEYFGTHYASSPEKAGKSWNTVRSYGSCWCFCVLKRGR
jgi:hypothetical protein